MVCLLILGAECGISISCRAFEEMSFINSVQKSSGYFYVNMKPKYNLITDTPSKVYEWKMRYFYVKINEASVPDVHKKYKAK